MEDVRAASTAFPVASLRLVQLALVLVVLAALPYKLFELDRFFVPKELVLHLAAAGAAVLALRRAGRAVVAPEDAALGAFLLLGAVSALLATNGWVAVRALGVSASGILLFWTARAAARAGHRRALLGTVALAAVVAVGTSLLQAYGVRTEYFSLNRSPGGTFGNRNFVAHVAAIGLPAVVAWALLARRAGGFLLGLLATAATAAVLFLTRSRGAWLAAASALAAMAVVGWAGRRAGRRAEANGGAPPPGRSPRADQTATSRDGDPHRAGGGRRLTTRPTILAAAGVIGVVLALALPNSLNWASDSPYLDSARGLVDYRGGSGAGRLVQYRRTLRMALDAPAVGVGPGNWAVAYPRYAAGDDPSLGSDGMTSNPWPSSDWVAFAAERGPLATVLLLAALVMIGLRGMVGAARAATADDATEAAALVGVLAALLVAGLFDAVLLLAAPALVAWTALGALVPASPAEREGGRPLDARLRRWSVIGVTAAGLLFAGRSLVQWAGMALASGDHLATAAAVDRGSYRLAVWAARDDARHGRCGRARDEATRAHDAFPDAAEPKRLLAVCRKRRS